MAENKEKKYVSDNAQLMAEWDWEKNNKLDPTTLMLGSGKKVWWKCANGHEWEAKITDCNRGHGCPYCSGRKAISGENDLFTIYPKLKDEWYYIKNINIKPNELKPNSHLKARWICKNGHIWEAIIKNRVNGHGCPYCAQKKAYPGENDLLSKYPQLSKEWHPTKNNISAPKGVACYSNTKVWWLGICGHEWQDTPGHRVLGRGCPVCNNQNKTSFPEQAIYYYISKKYPDAVNRYTSIFLGTMELDIYVPSLKVAIEYDGEIWHNSKTTFDREIKKYTICKDNDIELIRVKEHKKSNDEQTSNIIIYCSEDLNSTIKNLANYFMIDIDIDVDRDRFEILNTYLSNKAMRSFATKHPFEASEWHPSKNGKLSPSMFTCGSSEKVWWMCSKGHEWQMPISERSLGNGCPYCSNHRVLYGYNDLQTKNPELAKEWHPTKNLSITPNNILSSSSYKVWWMCKHGHEWQAVVRDRARGRGCPYCANKRILVGYNDLQSINPQLSQEWNYEKNGELNPYNFTAHSSKKVWWKCSYGHEWVTTINNRTRGSGCPECAKEKRKKNKIDS